MNQQARCRHCALHHIPYLYLPRPPITYATTSPTPTAHTFNPNCHTSPRQPYTYPQPHIPLQLFGYRPTLPPCRSPAGRLPSSPAYLTHTQHSYHRVLYADPTAGPERPGPGGPTHCVYMHVDMAMEERPINEALSFLEGRV
jgi:hypothetical protein